MKCFAATRRGALLAGALMLVGVGDCDFPMLAGDAKAFVDKARGAKATGSMFVTKGRDHMGVVKALLEDESDVLEKVLKFLAKPE